jgi:hypothetical protein
MDYFEGEYGQYTHSFFDYFLLQLRHFLLQLSLYGGLLLAMTVFQSIKTLRELVSNLNNGFNTLAMYNSLLLHAFQHLLKQFLEI